MAELGHVHTMQASDTRKCVLQSKLNYYLTNIIHIFQYLILYKMRHFKTLCGFI